MDDAPYTIDEVLRAASSGTPAIGMVIRQERAAKQEVERQAVIAATRYGKLALFVTGLALLVSVAQFAVSIVH